MQGRIVSFQCKTAVKVNELLLPTSIGLYLIKIQSGVKNVGAEYICGS